MELALLLKVAMVHSGSRSRNILGAFLLLIWSMASAQQPPPDHSHLVELGQVVLDGHSVPYRIRRLPVSSFPDLPARVANTLSDRECLIPQTFRAHRPENVVRASLERTGSSDWAVLCSAKGTVSLLVFFAGATGEPTVLASFAETERLESYDRTGVLGFNWGIDPASPTSVHEAQTGMEHRPPLLDHDALADSLLDRRTIYHFYSRSKWALVEMPD